MGSTKGQKTADEAEFTEFCTDIEEPEFRRI